LNTSEPDDVEKESLPEPWRKFLSRCTGRKLAHRLPDFNAVLVELAAVKDAMKSFAGTTSVEVGGGVSPEVVDQACVFSMKSKGRVAKGRAAAKGFTVLAGSQASGETFPAAPANIVDLRKALLTRGVLARSEDGLVFKADYTFESISAAASVVAGRAANGRVEWKTAVGRPFKEVQDAIKVEPAADPEDAAGAEEREDATTSWTGKRQATDKPVILRWQDEAVDREASSWKGVLVAAAQRVLTLGRSADALPIPWSPNGEAYRSPAEVTPGLFIETHGSSKAIRQRISEILKVLGKRGGFLLIRTAAGNEVALPE
jgi:hypothetical protein